MYIVTTEDLVRRPPQQSSSTAAATLPDALSTPVELREPGPWIRRPRRTSPDAAPGSHVKHESVQETCAAIASGDEDLSYAAVASGDEDLSGDEAGRGAVRKRWGRRRHDRQPRAPVEGVAQLALLPGGGVSGHLVALGRSGACLGVMGEQLLAQHRWEWPRWKAQVAWTAAPPLSCLLEKTHCLKKHSACSNTLLAEMHCSRQGSRAGAENPRPAGQAQGAGASPAQA
jgi:hypothetical protein